METPLSVSSTVASSSSRPPVEQQHTRTETNSLSNNKSIGDHSNITTQLTEKTMSPKTKKDKQKAKKPKPKTKHSSDTSSEQQQQQEIQQQQQQIIHKQQQQIQELQSQMQQQYQQYYQLLLQQQLLLAQQQPKLYGFPQRNDHKHGNNAAAQIPLVPYSQIQQQLQQLQSSFPAICGVPVVFRPNALRTYKPPSTILDYARI